MTKIIDKGNVKALLVVLTIVFALTVALLLQWGLSPEPTMMTPGSYSQQLATAGTLSIF